MRILIEAKRDPMGGLILNPVRDDLCAKIAEHMHEWTGNRDERAYIEEYNADEYMDEHIPPEGRRTLKQGWGIRFKCDAWTFAHLYGWDAQTLFE